ncbi:hypothetical protein HDU86_004755 [Geranomyces michiganensis]|nr:hypothetical protein HDU86_004755 [Geranomyces michiganensis]
MPSSHFVPHSDRNKPPVVRAANRDLGNTGNNRELGNTGNNGGSGKGRHGSGGSGNRGNFGSQGGGGSSGNGASQGGGEKGKKPASSVQQDNIAAGPPAREGPSKNLPSFLTFQPPELTKGI